MVHCTALITALEQRWHKEGREGRTAVNRLRLERYGTIRGSGPLDYKSSEKVEQRWKSGERQRYADEKEQTCTR